MQFSQKESLLHGSLAALVLVLSFAAQEPASSPDRSPSQAPAAGRPTSEIRRAVEWKRFDYTCEGGEKVTVFLHSNTAKVEFKGNSYLMKQVRSADGAKYSDGSLVWWGVGSGGFLQKDSIDGSGAMVVKDCKLDKPMNASPGTNSVTGTVTYMVRVALPATAIIQLQLLDVSLADAPAKVLAEEKITLGERQVPVPFSLTYEPEKIEQNHSYSVSAKILVDGELRFISDKSYPVITRGNGNSVELILRPVTATAAPKP